MEGKALANIDHVYSKCSESLKENIVFLYKMILDLKSKGYNIMIVGKAFDDDLYAYVGDRVGEGGDCL